MNKDFDSMESENLPKVRCYICNDLMGPDEGFVTRQFISGNPGITISGRIALHPVCELRVMLNTIVDNFDIMTIEVQTEIQKRLMSAIQELSKDDKVI
jgi:hypothetical protein